MARKSNLPLNIKRTPEEQKAIARKAGIASGAARRKRRDLKEAMTTLLNAEILDDEDGKKKLGSEAIALAWFTKAKKGDVNAIKMILEALYGQPKQSVDVTSSDGSMTPKGGAVFDFSGLTPEERTEIAKAAFLGK